MTIDPIFRADSAYVIITYDYCATITHSNAGDVGWASTHRESKSYQVT